MCAQAAEAEPTEAARMLSQLKASQESAQEQEHEASRMLRFGEHASYREGRTTALGSDIYADWESIGIAAGPEMTLHELAEYKYHITIGGGGGTEFAGFVQKMAMGGLVFHHMTPTRDYIHDYFEPWVHYVPVEADLSDLKQKFYWAEANPDEARMIARQGTERIEYLTSPEGFAMMFENDMVTPLREIIGAYESVRETGKWNSWEEAVTQVGLDYELVEVIECVGMPHFHDSVNRCIETRPQ